MNELRCSPGDLVTLIDMLGDEVVVRHNVGLIIMSDGKGYVSVWWSGSQPDEVITFERTGQLVRVAGQKDENAAG